jgi:hypothetical protein
MSRIRCELCGEPAVAVAPGGESLVVAGVLVARGVPLRAWCMACLKRTFKLDEAA